MLFFKDRFSLPQLAATGQVPISNSGKYDRRLHVLRIRAIAATLTAFAWLTMALEVRAQAPEIFLATHPANHTRNLVVTTETHVEGYACVSDAAGNTYVAGSCMGTTVWGTNAIVSVGGYGNEDLALVKYSPTGEVLWVRKAGGVYKEEGRALALDGAGGVYLAGMTTSDVLSLSTNVAIGNEVNTALLVLARYDGDGNLLWARRAGSWMVSPSIAGSSANVWPNSLAVDSAGNPVVAGRFNGNPMFGGTLVSNIFSSITYTNGVVLSNRLQVASGKTEDLFLAKFSPSGNILWATNHGSTNVEYISSLALDSQDNLYAAGAFNKATTLGAASFTNSAYAPFLAKFNPNGVPVWASNLSEPTNNNSGFAWSVVVDSLNHVTVTFTTPLSYNVPFRLGTNSFTNLIFLASATVMGGAHAQFETNGTLRWMKKLPFNIDGLSAGSPNTFAPTLTRDNADNLYVRSVSSLTTNGTTLGKSGIHVLKLTPDGLPLWTNSVTPVAISFPDNSVNDRRALPAISLDGTGRISVVASISGDSTATGFIGWTNITTAFTNGFGNNQLFYRMESNYVAVAPQFITQPTNIVFQPPQGMTNSALARAWPVADYRWYMVSNGVPTRIGTNFIVTIPNGTTVAHVTSYYCVASNLVQQTTSSVFIAQAKLALYPPVNIVTNVLIGGSSTFSINATGTTAFTYQWRMNGTNLPGATNQSLLVNYPTFTSGTNRYDMIACNDYGCLTSSPPITVTVKAFGTIDSSFAVGSAGRQVLVEPTGTPLDGGRQLIRYTTNGIVVTNGFYNPTPPAPGQVSFFYPAGIGGAGPNIAFNRDPDGKIVVGGHFSRLNTNGTTGPALNRMVRFNSDGMIDTNFSVGTGPAVNANNTFAVLVRAIVRQSDGRYLVGGMFDTFNGVARTNLVRLNDDGSVDTSFVPAAFIQSTSPSSQPGVRAIALRANGGIVVAHEFLRVGTNTYRPCIAGLTTNGAADAVFNDNLPVDQSQFSWGSFSTGRGLAIQPDGKILFAGQFGFQTGGFSYSRVVRFNDNGTLDPTFKQTNFISGAVNAVALQADGKVVFGGDNMPVYRVNPEGTNDWTFGSDPLFVNSQLEGVAVDAAGQIYVTGAFGLYRLFGALPTTGVPPPTFSAGTAVRLPNGQFGFTTCGQNGQTLVIQASTNLVDWISISTNPVVAGCINFSDPESLLIPNRLYRVFVQP